MLEQTGAMMTFGLQPVTKSTIIETEKRGGNPMNIATESQLCTHFFFFSVNMFMATKNPDPKSFPIDNVRVYVSRPMDR